MRNQFTGATYRRITTHGHHSTRHAARVKTYGDMLREHVWHPESKCADCSGHPCEKSTIGLLRRRHVGIETERYVGKKSNRFDDVLSGLVHTVDSVYVEYGDPRHEKWRQAANVLSLKEVGARKRQVTSHSHRRATGATATAP